MHNPMCSRMHFSFPLVFSPHNFLPPPFSLPTVETKIVSIFASHSLCPMPHLHHCFHASSPPPFPSPPFSRKNDSPPSPPLPHPYRLSFRICSLMIDCFPFPDSTTAGIRRVDERDEMVRSVMDISILLSHIPLATSRLGAQTCTLLALSFPPPPPPPPPAPGSLPLRCLSLMIVSYFAIAHYLSCDFRIVADILPSDKYGRAVYRKGVLS